MADNQQHITPTAELIQQYLEGKLDGRTMHALEKQALDDPFLADALEGYVKYPANQQPALSELQQRLQQRVAPAAKKVRRLDYRWLAAASVLVILCITAVMVLNRPEKGIREIAQTSPLDSVKLQGNQDITAKQYTDSNQAGDVTPSEADQTTPSAEPKTTPSEADKTTPAAEPKTTPAVAPKIAPSVAQNAISSEAIKAPAPVEQIAPPSIAKKAKDAAVQLEEASAASTAKSVPALEKAAAGAVKSKQEAEKGNIVIRGISRINKNATPLILMDGVPVKLDSLQVIDPKSVASITILKDAQAHTLYGSEAANGVMLVTTVKGSLYKKQDALAANDSYSYFRKSTPDSTNAPKFALKGIIGNRSILAADNVDTIHIRNKDKSYAGMLDSKVEGVVTGAKSNFTNYYTDDDVRKISGVVVDEQTGRKIPGVYVSVNGNNRGAITDTAGNFALHVGAKSKAELGFSSMGYLKKNVTVSQSTNNLNVALPARNNGLNEVVVVGYGSKEKKSLFPPFPVMGDEVYTKYLETNKKVAIAGLKVPLEGEVHISFTVMPDGSLQDFKVLQGMGKEADRVAIKNIKDGPKWMPASNQKKATVELKVPIELIKKAE